MSSWLVGVAAVLIAFAWLLVLAGTDFHPLIMSTGLLAALYLNARF